MSQRRTCLVYNPAAGRGRPPLERLRRWKRIDDSVARFPTEYPGHATVVVQDAIAAGFSHIIAAGGDGTVHEVANGILKSGTGDCVLTTLPWGSANDYALTLGMTRWIHEGAAWAELQPMLVDVGRVQAPLASCYFVNGCGIGFNGCVTIESRSIHGLTGIPLYAVAMIRAMIRYYRAPAIRITLDDVNQTQSVLAFTIGLAQREGGFPLTKLAKLDDGFLDWLKIGPVSRWELLRNLPNMISGDLPTDHPHVHRGQAKVIAIESPEPLCMHADGELVCVPSQPQFTVQVELLPKRLWVNTYPKGLYGQD